MDYTVQFTDMFAHLELSELNCVLSLKIFLHIIRSVLRSCLFLVSQPTQRVVSETEIIDKKRSEINLEDLLCFNGYVVEQPTSKLSQFINLSKAFFFHSTSLMEAKNIYERYFRHYLLSEKVKTGL